VFKDWFTTKKERVRLDAFITSFQTSERVLDLGCGKSRYTPYFPNRIGVDRARKIGVDVVGDALHLPLKTASFSLIISTEMLEHVRDPQKAIDEMQRLLKPGGKVVLTTRFTYPIHEAPDDYYRFTRYGLSHLFRNWRDVEIKTDTRPFESIGILFQRSVFQSEFKWPRIVSAFLLVIGKLMGSFDSLVRRQFGDSSRRVAENQILSSGYFVVAVN